MKAVHFEGDAYRQFVEWAGTDPKIFGRIDQLARDISRSPFKGL